MIGGIVTLGLDMRFGVIAAASWLGLLIVGWIVNFVLFQRAERRAEDAS